MTFNLNGYHIVAVFLYLSAIGTGVGSAAYFAAIGMPQTAVGFAGGLVALFAAGSLTFALAATFALAPIDNSDDA